MARARAAAASGDTLHQSTTKQNDKFRAEIRAEHLAEYEKLDRGDDLEKFRAEQYKEALRDAKAAHKAKS
jgi:hypothetical protein